FFSSRRRHTRSYGDWSSDVCSSDLQTGLRQRDVVIDSAAANREDFLSFLVWHRQRETAGGQVLDALVAESQDVAGVFRVIAMGRSEERRVGEECGCRWWRHGVEVTV